MGFIRLDKVRASAHYESMVIKEELKDGQFVVLKDSEDDYGEKVSGEKAKENSIPHGILCNVHIDRGSQVAFDIREASIPVGDSGRVLIFENGDVISASQDLTQGLEKGDMVAVGKDGYGFKKASENDAIIGSVIGTDFITNIGNVLAIRFFKSVSGSGSAGKDGADGKDGVNGKDGKDGKNGVDGKDGVNGKDGKDAEDSLHVIRAIVTKSHTGELELLQLQMSDNSVIQAEVFERPDPSAPEVKEEEEEVREQAAKVESDSGKEK